MRTHTLIYSHILIYFGVLIHIGIHTYIVYSHTYIQMYMYVCIYMYVYVCLYIHVYVCMHNIWGNCPTLHRSTLFSQEPIFMLATNPLKKGFSYTSVCCS